MEIIKWNGAVLRSKMEKDKLSESGSTVRDKKAERKPGSTTSSERLYL